MKCAQANLRQTDKHIRFNRIKVFGNTKCFHRPISKPQGLVIQALVTGINNCTSTEGSPEGDFLNGELDLQETKSIYVKMCNLVNLND